MKFSALLTPAILAAAVLASSESESSSSSSSSPPASFVESESSLSSSSVSEEPTPVASPYAQLWSPESLTTYDSHCKAIATLNAELYTLGEMYPALKEWAPELKVFYHRQEYPGSWEGVDDHGNERTLIKMETADLPVGVREWIKNHEKQRHFSVQDDVVFFAPGAMYPILPLWVEEPEEGLGDCEGVFTDLENYVREPTDEGVIASLEHKSTGKNKIELKIEAQQLRLKKDARPRDEL